MGMYPADIHVCSCHKPFAVELLTAFNVNIVCVHWSAVQHRSMLLANLYVSPKWIRQIWLAGFADFEWKSDNLHILFFFLLRKLMRYQFYKIYQFMQQSAIVAGLDLEFILRTGFETSIKLKECKKWNPVWKLDESTKLIFTFFIISSKWCRLLHMLWMELRESMDFLLFFYEESE